MITDLFCCRFDRDVYMEVQWDNIKPNQEHNFYKNPRTLSFPKFPYDFTSIQQYGLYDFGIDGKPTLVLTVLTQNYTKLI